MQAAIAELELTYEQMMARWGRCTDGEKATVSFLLRILRTHGGYSEVCQRCGFGLCNSDFRRLQRMRRPREDHFGDDVRQMALACNIRNIPSFVAMMEHATRLAE